MTIAVWEQGATQPLLFNPAPGLEAEWLDAVPWLFSFHGERVEIVTQTETPTGEGEGF